MLQNVREHLLRKDIEGLDLDVKAAVTKLGLYILFTAQEIQCTAMVALR